MESGRKNTRGGAARIAARKRNEAVDVRPIVRLSTDEHVMIDEATAALSAAQEGTNLFSRAGKLVTVDVSGDSGAKVVPLSKDSLRPILTKSAQITNESGEKRIHPPDWLPGCILAAGGWRGLRELAGITNTPVLLPDGRVHTQPGYDPESKVYLCGNCDSWRLPEAPTVDDAKNALNQLKDVLADFKFEDESHLSGAIAAVLTPLARTAYKGPTPMFVLDANKAGVGKGLLANVIATIATGQPPSMATYTNDTSELEKRLTAILRAGSRLVVFDNVDVEFGNGVLDCFATSVIFNGRRLGASEMLELSNHTTILATGNNFSFKGDTSRRIIHIRQISDDERPENRTGFKYPDLGAHLQRNRDSLCCAAVTILSAYIRSGCPGKDNLKSFGSFEGWSIVRGALVWLGMPDPLRKIEAADERIDIQVEFMDAWEGCCQKHNLIDNKATVSRVHEILYGSMRSLNNVDNRLRNVLEVACKCQRGFPPTPKQFGRYLGSIKDSVEDGRRFVQLKRNNSGQVWHLESVGVPIYDPNEDHNDRGAA